MPGLGSARHTAAPESAERLVRMPSSRASERELRRQGAAPEHSAPAWMLKLRTSRQIPITPSPPGQLMQLVPG
jgi:hypothetical protein